MPTIPTRLRIISDPTTKSKHGMHETQEDEKAVTLTIKAPIKHFSWKMI